MFPELFKKNTFVDRKTVTDKNKVLNVFAQISMLTYKMEPFDKLID